MHGRTSAGFVVTLPTPHPRSPARAPPSEAPLALVTSRALLAHLYGAEAADWLPADTWPGAGWVIALAGPDGAPAAIQPAPPRAPGAARHVGQVRGVLAERVAVSTPLDPFLSLKALVGYSGIGLRKLYEYLTDPTHPLPHLPRGREDRGPPQRVRRLDGGLPAGRSAAPGTHRCRSDG
jgi:hypothetical protein